MSAGSAQQLPAGPLLASCVPVLLLLLNRQWWLLLQLLLMLGPLMAFLYPSLRQQLLTALGTRAPGSLLLCELHHVPCMLLVHFPAVSTPHTAGMVSGVMSCRCQH